MDGIKTEYNLLCHGCLSNDRRMAPLGENSEIFFSLIGNRRNQTSAVGSDDVKLCWECSAKVKNFKIFKTQVCRAQEVLVEYLFGLETQPLSLSKLTINMKNFYDQDIKQENTRKRGKNKQINTNDHKKDHTKKKICNRSIARDIKEERISETREIIDSDEAPDIEHDENKPLVVYTHEILPDIVSLDKNKADKYTNEVLPDIVSVDKNKADMYTDEVFPHIEDDDDDKADIFCGDDIDAMSKNDETKLICDIKLEPVQLRNKKEKKVKKKTADKHKWRNKVKEFATLVQTKEVDWGSYEKYFTTLHFSEKEMEQHIFGKERRYADLKKYRFSCTVCKLGYKRPLDLKRHNNLNHRNLGSPHKCTFCHTLHNSQTELEAHWREHSPIAKCNLCCHVLRPRGMLQHLNLAHTKQYACGKCRLTFETIKKYLEHFKKAHTTYTCDYCHKDFKHRTRISYHISNMHVPTFCVDCNRPFPNQNRFYKHCILMHPHRINRTEAQEAAFCVECNKQYNSIQQYRKHLRISPKHNEVKRQDTPCPECGKIFARKHYMTNHYNLYHLKKTKFYCDLCNKYFARGFGLRVHNTYVHQKMPKVRDKICDICGRAFNSNRTMLNHRRTHTGERPHKCPYCTAEFIQKYAMQTHMRTQHKHFS